VGASFGPRERGGLEQCGLGLGFGVTVAPALPVDSLALVVLVSLAFELLILSSVVIIAQLYLYLA
jgi:hypothetical protein